MSSFRDYSFDTLPTLRRLLFDVAVNHFGRVAALRERLLHGFRQHHRAMLSARAAYGYRQIALALANVMRNQIGKQALDAAQEFSGLRERANVLANLWIRAVVWAQTWNEMRIGKKAHVKDQVRIRRHAITIAKADHGNQQRPRVGILEARGNEVAKLVHVELRGIDDH